MIHAPFGIWAVVFAFALASLAYTAFAVFRLVTLRANPAAESGELPAVTILKPLAGLEPELERNLRSFCEQEYPRYRVIFCAQNAGDPALEVAARAALGARAETAIVSGGGAPVANPKIRNLLAAMPLARGEIVVVADSDMRVEPAYLRRVVQAFADPGVGAATALYGAVAVERFIARLGAMFVNDQFAPSVLVAMALQPLRYCFGATMAVRIGVLEEIGGFDAIGASIADDYALGDLVSRGGHRVALAGTVPLTLVSEPTLGALLAREIRWARTIRTMRPFGYAGSVVAFPIAFALLNLALSPSTLWAGAVLLAATLLRTALHVAAHRILRIPGRATPLLVPLREALSVLVWVAGLVGTRARWRGAATGLR